MLNDLFQNIYKCYSGFFKINILVLKNMALPFYGEVIKYKENLKCWDKSYSKKIEAKYLSNISDIGVSK
jgi:hypothetical protein